MQTCPKNKFSDSLSLLKDPKQANTDTDSSKPNCTNSKHSLSINCENKKTSPPLRQKRFLKNKVKLAENSESNCSHWIGRKQLPNRDFFSGHYQKNLRHGFGLSKESDSFIVGCWELGKGHRQFYSFNLESCRAFETSYHRGEVLKVTQLNSSGKESTYHKKLQIFKKDRQMILVAIQAIMTLLKIVEV